MPNSTPPPLNTRRPTGKMPWPLLLFAGVEKAGKSWAALEASASPLVHRTFLIEVGESYGDAYAAIPGADYEIVEHDGTYNGIFNAVWAATAAPFGPNGEPNLIVLDSGSVLWDLIVSDLQATANSRRSKNDADITMDLWNAGKRRWSRVVDMLRQYQGPAIITARFGEKVVVVNGRPTEMREWKPTAEKNLPYDVDGVVEWREPRKPQVTRMRSVRKDFGTGDAVPLARDHMWENLVKTIGFDPAQAGPRDFIPTVTQNLDDTPDVQAPDPKLAAAQIVYEQAAAAATSDEIAQLGATANEQKFIGYPVDTGAGGRMSLRDALLALHQRAKTNEQSAQHARREQADDAHDPERAPFTAPNSAQHAAQDAAHNGAQDAAHNQPSAHTGTPPAEPHPSPAQSREDLTRARLVLEQQVHMRILGVNEDRYVQGLATDEQGRPLIAGLALRVAGARKRVADHFEQAGDTLTAQAWRALGNQIVGDVEAAVAQQRDTLAAALELPQDAGN